MPAARTAQRGSAGTVRRVRGTAGRVLARARGVCAEAASLGMAAFQASVGSGRPGGPAGGAPGTAEGRPRPELELDLTEAFRAVAQGLGYPTPEVLAIYHPSRAFGRAPSLRDSAEIAAFLRDGMRYPCFAKPVLGRFSHGAHAITSVDRAGDALRFWDGSTSGVEAFAAALDPVAEGQLATGRGLADETFAAFLAE
jgi:hypothetical protein